MSPSSSINACLSGFHPQPLGLVFGYAHGRPFNAFRSLLGIAGDVTAPTYAELYSGAWQHLHVGGVGRNRIGKDQWKRAHDFIDDPNLNGGGRSHSGLTREPYHASWCFGVGRT
jgi:hypothetical protein